MPDPGLDPGLDHSARIKSMKLYSHIDRVAFIDAGRMREVVGVEQLRATPELLRRYVGVSASP